MLSYVLLHLTSCDTSKSILWQYRKKGLQKTEKKKKKLKVEKKVRKNKYPNTPNFGLKCSICTAFDCNKPQNGCHCNGWQKNYGRKSMFFTLLWYVNTGICKDAICLKHSGSEKEKSVSNLLWTKKPNFISKQKELNLSL